MRRADPGPTRREGGRGTGPGDGLRGATAVLVATSWLLLAPVSAPAQEEAAARWDCFRSWAVATMQETDAFTVERSPWALRWERTTPTHSDLDGLFAELYRVEEGEKTEDQVAVVNTDHEGHEGTVTVEETGSFWLSLESWSERTEWRIEACVPGDSTVADTATRETLSE